MIKSFDIKLEIITPLLIKSGDDFSMIEGLIYDGYLYIFDLNKILHSSLSESFKKFIDSCEKKTTFDLKDFFNYYRENLKLLLPFVIEKIPVEEADITEKFEAKKIAKFIRYFDFKNGVYQLYIPGSSLKGSFINCLYEKKKKEKFLLSSIAFEDFYFSDFKRKIRKITRRNPLKKNRGVSVYAEFVEEGVAQGRIYIPARAENSETLESLIRDVFNSKADYYKTKNQRFLSFFSDSFKKKLDIEVDNYLILPLGFGSRSYEKFPRGKSYYCLTNQNDFDPIGVVKLTIETDEKLLSPKN